MQIFQQVIAIVIGVIKEPIVFQFHLNLFLFIYVFIFV